MQILDHKLIFLNGCSLRILDNKLMYLNGCSSGILDLRYLQKRKGKLGYLFSLLETYPGFNPQSVEYQHPHFTIQPRNNILSTYYHVLTS